MVHRISLAEANPELAKEWHPTKNGDLLPSQIDNKSNKRVWWLLSYDDPVTGKRFDFEWKNSVINRVSGSGCPYLSKPVRKLYKGFNDFETFCLYNDRQELLSEWHPTKNGDLKPSDVISGGGGRKVWWFKPYDDPKTGRHFDFEWEASISSRLAGVGCPFLASYNAKVWRGFNDFETFCKDNDLQHLLSEWHPTKNGDLKPGNIIAAGSTYKIWWRKSYDDPITGKHFDFEWESYIYNRTRGAGCPFLREPAKAVWYGFNDVETFCKLNNKEYLLDEWHPTKNGDLKPSNCVRGSEIMVWWLKPYDDPITGKHFDFEWKATLNNRVLKGVGCPFLSNKSVWSGFNDLKTVCEHTGKEYLIEEWDYDKNGELKPELIAPSSGKLVWWHKPYDDPNTGKHFDFSWKATACSRFNGNNCPYLAGQAVWTGFNDLETYCKVNGLCYLLEEWHPIKNGKLKPSMVNATSPQKIWWYKPYDDPRTGKHFEFEWSSSLQTRIESRIGCPFISSRSVWSGFNDLETWCNDNSKEYLLSEWDYKKNKEKPNKIAPSCNEKVWWRKSYDDPITGRHFEFEWKAQVQSRTMGGTDCPYLTGRAVYPGFNDLETYCLHNNRQELLNEWHYKKNGNLKPSDVLFGSHVEVWWLKPYDDSITGKHFDFEWKAGIGYRVYQNIGCPFLSNRSAWKGYNDLETYCRINGLEYLLDEWNYKKNRQRPEEVLPGMNSKVWWIKPYDDPITGKHFDFEWKTSPNVRVFAHSSCPFLVDNPAVWTGFNDLETWCKINNMEYLLDEWHLTKNGKVTPKEVAHSSGKKRWWKCGNGHEWRQSPNQRNKGSGCPYCYKKEIAY